MTDIAAQLDALRNSAAFAPLTDRAFLRITGSDATRWLNGMVTNNIRDLKPGEGSYNFLLNAQGRIQGDCTIYREPGDPATYLLETSAPQLEPIRAHLDHFIIMDDVELTTGLQLNGQAATSGFAIAGPQAPEVVKRSLSGPHEVSMTQAPAPGTMSFGMVNGANVLILSPPQNGMTQYEVWFENDHERDVERDILQYSGLSKASPAALEAFRILSGVPLFGADIRTTDLPQETAQQHALHFNKGCYLGQEIVERIRSRGQVHRTFTQFTLEGAMPQLPAQLTAEGKLAGELTSVAEIDGRLLALGYVRRELASKPLIYEGGSATPQNSRTQNS